ncbi:ATP-binding protein [Ferruginibacter sp. SUN106]|uniref:ATP-binding protein n=1 Tax=Ferruginibacter sp. SUN106 TaxID=2978348 RepID=UPI003D35ADDA
MAKRKLRIKCLLISPPKRMDFLQPVIKEVTAEIDADIQLELYSQIERNIVIHSRQREKDFAGMISSSDLILVDLRNISATSFFEIGIARAIGKPIIFIAEDVFIEDLPDFLRQSYLIAYGNKDELSNRLKKFFVEYIENPKRFTPRSIVEPDVSSQIVVDLDKLEQREFENLCFELLSRLGYKQLEWRIKDEFIDAITTLRKRDPDGFEYEEFWLVSFNKEFVSDKMFDIALHDPEYFVERVYRNLIESDLMNRSSVMLGRGDVPVTILFVLRGKENYPKRLIKDLSKRDFRMDKRRYPFTIRIRWWDEQIITSLIQNNLQLARKYFSSEALTKSGIRLSYEELYKQNIGMYEELEKINEALIAERNRIELLERDAAWKLLSFTAAHRLGNPMDAIDSELSNLKLALSMKKPEVIDEIVKSMEIPIEKAKSIIAQFRNLSIAHEIKPENVKSSVLNDVLKNAAKQAIDKKVNVKFDFKNTPETSIDVQKMLECFEEIIRNSLHFVKGKNQQISISTSISKETDLPDKIDRTRKYLKIIFTDNGCGVPHEKKKEIFKPFERSYIHGTGLGLAFCEIIVEKHGGKIREIGKPGEGAVFEIFLPILEKDK